MTLPILTFGLISLTASFLACSKTDPIDIGQSDLNLVASTPGARDMLDMLAIEADTIDFIRWEISIDTMGEGKGKFAMHINYGIAEQGTPGFQHGDEHKVIEGTFQTKPFSPSINDLIMYTLTDAEHDISISFVQLNPNLYHLLTFDENLMVGNGGFSYTLNNLNPVLTTTTIPLLTIDTFLNHDEAAQVIFDGRTPCEEIKTQYNLEVIADCIKLKWRLTLNRDPGTKQPTSYGLRYVDHEATDVTGTWSVAYGLLPNSSAPVIKLHPADGSIPLTLLAGDEHVLFFLNPDYELLVGNSDFSFTFNRKS